MKLNDSAKKLDCLSGRLYALYHDKYDIENDCHALTNLIADMEKKAILPSRAADTIRKHITGKTKILSIDWLKIYCNFFGCSADYLLGYIDAPTHEITDINKSTGLSPAAIKSLLKADTDTKIIIDRLLAGNYLKGLSAAIKSFFSLGAAVEVKKDNIDNSMIKEFEKAAATIRVNIIRNAGADIINNLAFDKQVGKHFIEKNVDILYKKQLPIYKKATNNNKAVMDYLKVSAANMKKELIDSFNNTNNK